MVRGAIVVVAVSSMMKVGKMRALWRLRRADFWLAVIAAAFGFRQNKSANYHLRALEDAGAIERALYELRLNGRPGSLRAVVDMRALGERTVTKKRDRHTARGAHLEQRAGDIPQPDRHIVGAGRHIGAEGKRVRPPWRDAIHRG